MACVGNALLFLLYRALLCISMIPYVSSSAMNMCYSCASEALKDLDSVSMSSAVHGLFTDACFSRLYETGRVPCPTACFHIHGILQKENSTIPAVYRGCFRDLYGFDIPPALPRIDSCGSCENIVDQNNCVFDLVGNTTLQPNGVKEACLCWRNACNRTPAHQKHTQSLTPKFEHQTIGAANRGLINSLLVVLFIVVTYTS